MNLTWNEQLNLLKKRRKKTIAEIAEEAGISTGTVQGILAGKGSPRVDHIEAIATALDATINIEVVPDD